MPTARFLVQLSVNGRFRTSGTVVANLVKYLAYADQTDLFGYHGEVEFADSNESDRTVTIEFVAPVTKEDVTAFLDECDKLARVESAECLSNPYL